MIGTELLKSCARTSFEVPLTSILPFYLSCTPPQSSSSTLRPSHIIAITSNDSDRILLLPIHGLIFASISPILSILSSKIDLQPFHPNLPNYLPEDYNTTKIIDRKKIVQLPVVHLSLPSSKAFPILQAFIYTRSSSLLLSSLLPKPLSSTSSTTSSSIQSILNPTSASLSNSYSKLPPQILLEKIELIHGLWQNIVALEIGEEGNDMGKELWSVLRVAWEILLGALVLRQSEGRQ